MILQGGIMRHSAFTMIELIFVIVILGILAAVAIPRLAATRDDAAATKASMNLAAFISDIGGYYTSHGSATASDSNVVLANDGCFTASFASSGALVTIASTGTTLACTTAHSIASKAGNLGVKDFGGSNISY
jgi:prepilin-type N-terminal cleavage/methylation domain-containing protein